eukprot:11215160-Lingulodinium_polyedra.AAC.1
MLGNLATKTTTRPTLVLATKEKLPDVARETDQRGAVAAPETSRAQPDAPEPFCGGHVPGSQTGAMLLQPL